MKREAMKRTKFGSPKEMVVWLIDNEGKQLVDTYGRKWKYVKNTFWYSDIGKYYQFKESLKNLHLHGSSFWIHSA